MKIYVVLWINLIKPICYSVTMLVFIKYEMPHPVDEMILLHLLRYRLLAVKNYSVTACALQLKQNHFVKYPAPFS